MKIFSNFKDYYDNIGFNTNEDRVWERYTQYFKFNFFKNDLYKNAYQNETPFNILTENIKELLFNAVIEKPVISTKRNFFNSISFSESSDYCIILGFCGKLYCCMVHHRSDFGHSPANQLHSTHISFNSYVNEYNKSGNKDKLVLNKENFWSSSTPFTENGINDWNKKFNNQKYLDKLFIEFNSPIFIVKPTNSSVVFNDKSKGYNLIVNPCLADYKIQKLFDPYTAHQEVDMYLNNVLLNIENSNIIRTDELIRDSKGFNEWSFRQQGSKKKKRK